MKIQPPFIEWEVPVLVLISLTCQVVLVLLSNRRRYSKSPLLNAVLWAAYMGANAVATFALSVISTNLAVSEALDLILDRRIELQTFWAPFFLLHLGGPDTITAFEVEDNELWKRHLLTLVVQTGLTLYILFNARTLSSLTALSAMMFAAGSIKYAERTWCLWSASYKRCRRKAEKALYKRMPDDGRYQGDDRHLMRDDNDDDEEVYVKLARTAIVMVRDTEGMFADAFVNRKPRYKQIVEKISSPKVTKLIDMELQMMYDNLYTKARVILSYTGLALRFISFLLTCITLILFSSWERREHFRGITEYSLTFLLFAVSIGLELYAAFIFLTLYRTISWFRGHKMNGAARIMENLAKLRTRNWSNSMGQFSEIRYFKQYKTKGPLFFSLILPMSSIMRLHVYHRRVPVQLKLFIHKYLKNASTNTHNYDQQQLLFVQSKGRVPWNQYNKLDDDEHRQPEHDRMDPETLKHASSLFDREFGEIIIFLHLVTEVCYYKDRPFFAANVDDSEEYNDIFQTSRVSKRLSRYLMHLFVVSSDLLPQRTPLSKMRLYKVINPSWRPFFTMYFGVVEEKGKGKGQVDKENRRAAKEQACTMFWEKPPMGDAIDISTLRFAHNLLKVLRLDDVSQLQLKRRWEMLGAVWVELLVYAADQCKGKAHAEHLKNGGELLTHVWVLLGHFGFIDEATLPSKGYDQVTLRSLKDYNDESVDHFLV